jgi:4-methyl-5(b-hydroxyethyl)-thiazole monophosphate biosynthesis
MFLLLADGFEEIEALTPVDYLRRAGIDVKTVSISGNLTVTGSHGVQVIADMLIGGLVSGSLPKIGPGDGIILPGGSRGAENLAASADVNLLIKTAREDSLLICAICASPAVALAPTGALDSAAWTCYPGAEKDAGKAKKTWRDDRVVADGNIITSRAAGTAAEWSLKIIEKLLGTETRNRIASSVLLE